MSRVIGFLRREKVFSISLVLAIVSLPLNLSGFPYVGYIDGDVIMLLFALMGVVAGFRAIDTFDALARALLARGHNVRRFAFIMMSLCFFLSMLVTNDVALITLVPLTLSAIAMTAPEAIIPIVTLETIAANLGSMATPMGNPQNLYIYTAYGLSGAEFIRIMLPLTALSYVLLALCCLKLKRQPLTVPAHLRAGQDVPGIDSSRAPLKLNRNALMAAYALLAVVCLLALMKVIPKYVCCLVVLVALAVIAPRVLAKIDYALLATFACFFIFVGNVGAIPAVSTLLGEVIAGREMLLGALLSQVISNVPATFMLAPFASDIPALLRGVNLGGLGTPVASLASLIALKYYMCLPNSDMRRFMRVFLVLNFAFLAVLLLCTLVV